MWSQAEDRFYNSITEALRPIEQAETEWELPKLEKKIRGYAKNAAKTLEFHIKPWQILINDYADRFFSSIFQALGNREWLDMIDFVMVIDSGVRATFPGDVVQRVPQNAFERVVLNAHDRAFEEQRFIPLLWETLRNFPLEKKAQNRVYAAFDSGRKAAAVSSNGLVDDFVRWWVLKSFENLRRLCSSHGPPEESLPEDICAQLVHALLQANALPLPLTAQDGLPPAGWQFVDAVVADVYAGREPRLAKRAPARDRGTGRGGRSAAVKTMDSDSDDLIESNSRLAKRVRQTSSEHVEDSRNSGQGHPRCTQADDCVGHPGSRLVQHMLERVKGDVYCLVCWEAFRKGDPSLKAMPYND